MASERHFIAGFLYHHTLGDTLQHLARIFGCKKAVLKERSPSCGAGEIYDGSFTGARVPGDGVTAQLLKANGIAVFGESEIETLLEQLDEAQEEAPSFF